MKKQIALILKVSFVLSLVMCSPVSADAATHRFILPHLSTAEGWVTRIILFNNSAFTEQVNLLTYDVNGIQAVSKSVSVPAYSQKILVNTAPGYTLQSGEELLGSVEGTLAVETGTVSVRPLFSFQYGTSMMRCDFWGEDALAWEYIVPVIKDQRYAWQGLALTNDRAEPADIQFIGYRAGVEILRTTFTINPHEKKAAMLWQLGGQNAFNADQIRLFAPKFPIPQPITIAGGQNVGQDFFVFFPLSSTYPYDGNYPVTAPTDIQFVTIPAGEFQMGSNSGDAYADEQPVHRVVISKSFEMGKYEVTQGQWKAAMGNNPSYFTGDDNLPVEQVFWNDAQSFVQAMNARNDGYVYRLPTEAEWEYSCRAGTTGDIYGILDSIAWYDTTSGSKTHPVGQKLPNAWGLYDMLGNVWEWCSDWYDGNYYSISPLTDPKGPSSGSYRILRGGSWYGFPRDARVSRRGRRDPGNGDFDYGFRVCREKL